MNPTPLFRPRDADFVADPYPAYAELRAAGRVHHHAPTGPVAHPAPRRRVHRCSGTAGSAAAINTGSARGVRPDAAATAAHEPFHTLNDHGMLDLEPPDHTRIRRLVSQAFTPRTVERLAPTVHRLAARLVDDFVAAGGGDLLAEVAEPLPVAVIAEMLGIPEADRPLLRPWSAAICGMYELNPGEETAASAVRASLEFGGYLRELIAERRKSPGDDLISALIAAYDDESGAGSRLTEQEMISTCVLLLNAGHEATVNTTANGWWALLRNPGQLAALRAAPDALLPTAVEELMRYDTPLQLFERWVLEDIEFAGQMLPARQRGRPPLRLRQPRPGPVRRTRHPRPRPRGQPARLLRRRHPLLPRRTAGPARTPGLLRELLAKAPHLRLAAEPGRGPGFVIRGLTELQVTC